MRDITPRSRARHYVEVHFGGAGVRLAPAGSRVDDANGRVERHYPARAGQKLFYGSLPVTRLTKRLATDLRNLVATDYDALSARSDFLGFGPRESGCLLGGPLAWNGSFDDPGWIHREIRNDPSQQFAPIPGRRGEDHRGRSRGGLAGARHDANLADFDRVCHRPYDSRAMLPGRIPSAQVAEFATRGVSMAGTFRGREFGRLAPSIVSDPGYSDQIDVTCRFGQGPEGFPEIELCITGQVALACQRCLAPVRWDIGTCVRLTIVGEERQADGLGDPFDSISMDDGVLDLTAAIEDEILSATPLAPMHSAGAPCTETRDAGMEFGELQAVRNKPFAVLQDLIGNKSAENVDRTADPSGEK